MIEVDVSIFHRCTSWKTKYAMFCSEETWVVSKWSKQESDAFRELSENHESLLTLLLLAFPDNTPEQNLLFVLTHNALDSRTFNMFLCNMRIFHLSIISLKTGREEGNRRAKEENTSRFSRGWYGSIYLPYLGISIDSHLWIRSSRSRWNSIGGIDFIFLQFLYPNKLRDPQFSSVFLYFCYRIFIQFPNTQ